MHIAYYNSKSTQHSSMFNGSAHITVCRCFVFLFFVFLISTNFIRCMECRGSRLCLSLCPRTREYHHSNIYRRWTVSSLFFDSLEFSRRFSSHFLAFLVIVVACRFLCHINTNVFGAVFECRCIKMRKIIYFCSLRMCDSCAAQFSYLYLLFFFVYV